MPRVSVIIPTCNRATLIAQAIDSVLAQTRRDCEVIVVDDGSTDGTSAVLASYGDRITCLSQARSGAGAARNAGIRAATGEFLTFLDSDDLFAPTLLARMVAFLDEHPGVDVVHCGWQRIDFEGTRVIDEVRPAPHDDMLRALVAHGATYPPPMITLGTVVRRGVIDRAGLFDTSLETAEDVDFWIRVAKSGAAFGLVADPLGQWRVTPGSLGRDLEKIERGIPRMLAKTFDDPSLPPALAALRQETSARLYYGLGLQHHLNYVRTGAAADLNRALACFKTAHGFAPDVLTGIPAGWESPGNIGGAVERARFLSEITQIYSSVAEQRQRQRQLRANLELLLAFQAVDRGARVRAAVHGLRAARLGRGRLRHGRLAALFRTLWRRVLVPAQAGRGSGPTAAGVE